LSLLTPLPQTERPSWPAPAPSRRRGRGPGRGRSGFRFTRGWIALGVVVALALTAGGGYMAYLNTLPTTVSLSVANGQKEVPSDAHIALNFNRSVTLADLESHFTIKPAAAGAIVSVSGQTNYVWIPAKPLADLTTYTITVTSFTDVSKRKVAGGRWSFTTTIVPRIVSVTMPDGAAVTNGLEIMPGSQLSFNWNDAMDPSTVKLSLGAQPATLAWAKDDRSAAVSTSGIRSGPLVLKLAAGAKDQTGHVVRGAWVLDTGLYYRDREHTIALKFPALIQVPNDADAVDQDGLQAADVVFEYLAEGGITRLTAVYGTAPDLVGPMRSSRLVSLKIARHYRGLLFQSGESAVTRSAAGQDPVPQFFDTIGYTFRTNSRYAPDNLMISGDGVNRAEQRYPGIAAFTVPKARPDLTGGSPVTRVTVNEHDSTYTYDPMMGTYQKTEAGHTYRDAHLGAPLHIEMLIVLHTQESLLSIGDGHGSYIHDYNLDGTGKADVYYKGLTYVGVWGSADGHSPLTLTLGGNPVPMPPGLVWIDVTA
jgi:Protein of unknown function (DUF3048) N-terminal domain/Protein of unknown function (DUF3048) C-terminal domain/Bacterial Ig-like domain